MDELTIDDLPAEILVMIFSLIPECILEIRGVCKRWKSLEENDLVYIHPRELTDAENIIEMCRIFPRSKNVKASLIGSADSVRSVSEQIQHLSIIDMNISGILSLSLFMNLTYLNISREKGASMTDASQIRNLRKLIYLNMDGQGIGWLNGLEELTELRYLNLTDTLISDITPLKKLTKLQELYLTNTSVENIDALSELTDIILLKLGQTIITDISSISKLTKLEVLDISSTHVSDVSCLSRFSKLRHLNANYTQATDLSPLSNLTTLRYLNLWSVGRYIQGRFGLNHSIDFTCLIGNEDLSITTSTGTFHIEGGKIRCV
jgi:Leucine-rich repeat (LRR) protein